MRNLPDWVMPAIREMQKLKKGDILVFSRGKNDFAGFRYHVRGRVDDWIVVRFWRRHKPVGWRYDCLSPGWWSVYSKERGFKIIRKGRKCKI